MEKGTTTNPRKHWLDRACLLQALVFFPMKMRWSLMLKELLPSTIVHTLVTVLRKQRPQGLWEFKVSRRYREAMSQNIWFFKHLKTFMYIAVLPKFMYVHHMHTWCPHRPERGSGPLELGLYTPMRVLGIELKSSGKEVRAFNR